MPSLECCTVVAFEPEPFGVNPSGKGVGMAHPKVQEIHTLLSNRGATAFVSWVVMVSLRRWAKQETLGVLKEGGNEGAHLLHCGGGGGKACAKQERDTNVV